jgi:hypothetical protein
LGFELLLVPAIGWSLLIFDEVDGLEVLAAEDSPAALPTVPAAPEGLAEAPLEVQWSEMCFTSATLNEFPLAELVLVEPLGLVEVALELALLLLPLS